MRPQHTGNTHKESIIIIMASPSSPSQRRRLLLLGTFVHCLGPAELAFMHDAAVAVDQQGKIAGIEKDQGDVDKAKVQLLKTLGWAEDDVEVHASRPGQFFFPGFIGEMVASYTFT